MTAHSEQYLASGDGGASHEAPARFPPGKPAPVSARWEAAATVAGFRTGAPNPVLIEYAARHLERLERLERLGREREHPPATTPTTGPTAGEDTAAREDGAAREESTLRQARALDIGGGAARNALPLARLGFHVVCADLSLPMLEAARERINEENETLRAPVELVHAPMAPLPFDDDCFDLIVAHGIWNLARSGEELRGAVAEAARVARPGAGLFLVTFSRHTLPEAALPLPGETFVFTEFAGEPQCFLTEEEILADLGAAGFLPEDPISPLREYNRPPAPRLVAQGPPVLYEGTFRYRP